MGLYCHLHRSLVINLFFSIKTWKYSFDIESFHYEQTSYKNFLLSSNLTRKYWNKRRRTWDLLLVGFILYRCKSPRSSDKNNTFPREHYRQRQKQKRMYFPIVTVCALEDPEVTEVSSLGMREYRLTAYGQTLGLSKIFN